MEKEIKKEKKSSSSKVAMVVALRNKFFYMMYRYASLVFLSSIACFVMSVAFFIFFSKQPVRPQFIPVNEDGTYINLTPIADCNSKTDSEIQRFAMAGVKKIYKYDYINYSEQLQEAANYFTGQGWSDYIEAYGRSDVLTSVKENRQIVTVQPEGNPEIKRKPFIENGACVWELGIPIVVSYIGNSSRTEKGEIFLRVSRVSILKNQEGLGINRVVFMPK